jgi:choline dehydrogenase-like flavoprotein
MDLDKRKAQGDQHRCRLRSFEKPTHKCRISYSITSSVVASSVGGTVRPNADGATGPFHHRKCRNQSLNSAGSIVVMTNRAYAYPPLTHEPRIGNRIFYDGQRVMLDLTEANMEAHRRLKDKLRDLCGKLDIHPRLFDGSLHLGQKVPTGGTAHQAGTMRFGHDSSQSVLDLNCKAHEIDNLYVTDASFFPSIGAVNPTLTLIANALRVGDQIIARLK